MPTNEFANENYFAHRFFVCSHVKRTLWPFTNLHDGIEAHIKSQAFKNSFIIIHWCHSSMLWRWGDEEYWPIPSLAQTHTMIDAGFGRFIFEANESDRVY